MLFPAANVQHNAAARAELLLDTGFELTSILTTYNSSYLTKDDIFALNISFALVKTEH